MADARDAADGVVAVTMPQINVNDEQVVLVSWRVEDGEHVTAGQPLYEAETSKSVDELPAPTSGVVRQLARVGDTVAVGQTIGYIGPTGTHIDQYVKRHTGCSPSDINATPPTSHPIDATAGAIELARRYGLDLSKIPADGKIRRSDVERHLKTHGPVSPSLLPNTRDELQESLPVGLATLVQKDSVLSEHQWSVARHLAATRARIVPAHVAMDVSMAQALAWVEARRAAGQMGSLLAPYLHAAAAAVRAVPKLASFRLERTVYHYVSTDVAFTARSPDGRLFTPVVRVVGDRPLDDLASEIARLSMALFRGQLSAADLAGGCLTVSALSDQPVRWHIGLQNAYQSALVTIGAVRDELTLSNGQVTNRAVTTVALSYDHGLLDGWEVATALDAFRTTLEAIKV